MTGVTLLGPLPGDRVLDTQTMVLGELTDAPTGVRPLPPLVQLPARGPWATSVARTAAMLAEMPVELGTHGWKLADRPGADLGRIRSTMREDLDTLAVAAHDYSGPLVLSVRGPWTMASILWLARGDRVLSDHGAVRDLAAALAEGLVEMLRTVRTAAPRVEPVLVVREPHLPDVLAGTVPTFSGRDRLRSVEGPVVVEALRGVVAAVRGAGVGTVVAHGGGRFASRSFAALVDSGADAVGLSVGVLSDSQWEKVAAAVEGGTGVWFGLPATKKGKPADPVEVADKVARPWRAVGLPAAGLADVVVHVEASTSVSGGDLVLSDRREVRPALRAARDVAAELAERAVGG